MLVTMWFCLSAGVILLGGIPLTQLSVSSPTTPEAVRYYTRFLGVLAAGVISVLVWAESLANHLVSQPHSFMAVVWGSSASGGTFLVGFAAWRVYIAHRSGHLDLVPMKGDSQ